MIIVFAIYATIQTYILSLQNAILLKVRNQIYLCVPVEFRWILRGEKYCCSFHRMQWRKTPWKWTLNFWFVLRMNGSRFHGRSGSESYTSSPIPSRLWMKKSQHCIEMYQLRRTINHSKWIFFQTTKWITKTRNVSNNKLREFHADKNSFWLTKISDIFLGRQIFLKCIVHALWKHHCVLFHIFTL